MRVFLTGATGFIGTALVRELTGAGHRVTGLARSESGAAALAAMGAAAHHGSVTDLDSLRAGAAAAEGVIHLAFNHDFSRFRENCEEDRHAIQALGSALKGSGRPLLVTSGTAMASASPGRPATEDGPTVSSAVIPRAASEEAAEALAGSGVNVSVVRLPQVHDTVKQGLISYAIGAFLARGECAYVGNGENRWPAAAVGDVARLYRLALEKAAPNARYHAVAEEGVRMRQVVETVGARLGLPVRSITAEEAEAFFGWLAMFAGYDMPASSSQTRTQLGWHPAGPTMIEDLRRLALPR